jgi:ankyrin repeat protein
MQFTPLHFAAKTGKIEVCKILIELGADVYATTYVGKNMMHLAAEKNQAASLYFFMKLNVDINAQDSSGATPLHWACQADMDNS